MGRDRRMGSRGGVVGRGRGEEENMALKDSIRRKRREEWVGKWLGFRENRRKEMGQGEKRRLGKEGMKK